MVEEKSREDPVEAGVLEGQLVGEALGELELDTRALRLLPSPAKHLPVGVEAHHVGLWLALLHLDRERAGAAAEIEDALAGLRSRLLDQHLLEAPLPGGQPDHRVVDPSQGLEAQCREVAVGSHWLSGRGHARGGARRARRG